MSDTYNAAQPGGVAAGYGGPLADLYAKLHRQTEKKPLQAYYSPLAVVSDMANAFADKVQDNRILGAAQQGMGDANTALGLTGGGAQPDGFSSADHPATQSQFSDDDPTLQRAMSISSLAETSKTGTASLANISPDAGGSKSYGPWGLNDKSGSLGAFVSANPNLGLTAKPGTPEFDQQWRTASANNADAMLGAHQNWYKSRILGGVSDQLTGAGVNPQIANHPSVQAYMADRKLQMGTVGQNRVLAAAREATSPQDFISRVSYSDHANIPNDFRTYLRDYPNHAGGLGNRIERRQNGALSLAGGQQAPQGGGQGGDPANQVEGAGPSAGAGQPFQVAQAGGGLPPMGSPGGSAGGQPMGQPGRYIDPRELPPTMTPQQMDAARRALANPFLSQHQRDQIIQRMQSAQTPYEREVPGGKVVIDPRTNTQRFFDYGAQKVKEAGETAAAQKQAELNKENLAAESKGAHMALTGVRGLGVTGSNIEPYTSAALKIVNDPSFRQTGLVSADNQLLLERLKKQFNMPENAKPLAVLNQVRATVLNGMQSGAKSFSTEGGEAARLFLSEVDTMKGELPAANATAEEQIAGWNAVHRRAVKWGDDALYFNDWAKKQPNGIPTSDIHSEIIKRNRAFQPYDESVATPAAQLPFNQRFGDWNTGPGALGTAPSPTSGLQPGQAIPASSFTERSRNITRQANQNAGPGAALAGMVGGAPVVTGGAIAAARAAGMTLPKILEILAHGAATTGAIGAANKLWPGH